MLCPRDGGGAARVQLTECAAGRIERGDAVGCARVYASLGVGTGQIQQWDGGGFTKSGTACMQVRRRQDQSTLPLILDHSGIDRLVGGGDDQIGDVRVEALDGECAAVGWVDGGKASRRGFRNEPQRAVSRVVQARVDADESVGIGVVKVHLPLPGPGGAARGVYVPKPVQPFPVGVFEELQQVDAAIGVGPEVDDAPTCQSDGVRPTWSARTGPPRRW